MSETDVKDTIVKAATIFFSKYGFHKTTMDEIARHIHKAKGVIYYYFRSKEELFNEVLKNELEAIKEELGRISHSEEDSLTILNKYILVRLKMLSTAVIYHETLKADFFEKYDFVKDVRDDFVKTEYAYLKTIMLKGKKEGYLDIKHVDSNVNILLMLLQSIEFPLFLQDKYAEFAGTIEEMAAMVLSSLKVKKTS